MKRMLFVSLLLALIATTGTAKDNNGLSGKGPRRTAYLNDDNAVLDAGAFRMSVTNFGFFGNDNFERPTHLLDPCTGEWAPQMEYPKDSGAQYMFRGGLWIGAMIDNGEFFYPRVSVGTEGWQGDVEFFAAEKFSRGSCIDGYPTCLGESTYNEDGFAPQEMTGSYVDTLTMLPGGDMIDHPYDGVHIPLGIKVTETARAFSSAGYDKIAHFTYLVENVGDKTLKDVYLGLFVDADIGSYAQGDHWEDDVTGYRNESGVAFLMDNDGRPAGVSAGNEFTSPAALGVVPLPTPDQEQLRFSYNWWISNGFEEWDFGPAWVDDDSRDDWTRRYGTPVYDSDKYLLLSNGEIDYPTWRVDDPDWIDAHPQEFTDPQTGVTSTHQWREVNTDEAEELADGFDIRCLVSFGPFGYEEADGRYLLPGESIEITFAFVFGDDVHDVNNPQLSDTNLDPSKYDFSDLDAMANLLRELQAIKDTTPPPPAPVLKATFGLSGNVLNRYRSHTYAGTEFTFLRRLEGDTDWTTIAVDHGAEDFVYVDRTATIGETYQYAARATRANPEQASNLGVPCTVTVGAHSPVTNLTAEAGDGLVTLTWDPALGQTVDEYRILRSRQDDWNGDYSTPEAIDIVTNTEFTDDGVANGYYYTYQVQVVSNGIFGRAAESEPVLPVGIGERMLIVVNDEPSTMNPLWRPETIRDHFAALDWGNQQVDVEVQPLYHDSLTFPEMIEYDVLWFELDQYSYAYNPDYTLSNEQLPLYLESGGHIVVSGLNAIHLFFFNDYAELGSWHATSEYDPLPISQYVPFDSLYLSPQLGEWIYPNPTWRMAGLTAEQGGFANLLVDEDRHYFPYAPGIITYGTGRSTVMHPVPNVEVLYSIDFEDPSLEVDGEPGALLWHGESGMEDWGVACFGVPMYLFGPDADVAATMLQVADRLRTGGAGEAGPSIESAAAVGGELTMSLQPNPANASTTLHLSVPERGELSLRVYNVMGREVWRLAERDVAPGVQAVSLDASDLASGLYFVRAQAGVETATAKLMIVK